MPIEVPRSLVEFILLGPEDDRRQLQDSPILGDVWVEFAKRPADEIELLITPYKDQAAAIVARELSQYDELGDADIAYLQGIVAARLTFPEVLRFIVPMTQWWKEKRVSRAIGEYLGKPREMSADIDAIFKAAGEWVGKTGDGATRDIETRKRYIALVGLLLWAEKQDPRRYAKANDDSKEKVRRILDRIAVKDVVDILQKEFKRLREPRQKGLVWTVSLNRRASPALTKSVPAVKADAARTLFTVACSEIVWAVIDSGIDAGHPAFRASDGGGSRIKRSFDFTRIRDIVSADNLLNDAKRRKRVRELLKLERKSRLRAAEADEMLRALADATKKGRPIDWNLVERLVEIDPAKMQPPSNHGTHVAGILGARKDAEKPAGAKRPAAKKPPDDDADAADGDSADGMCPDIYLYDFRVLGTTLKETEFAIIAALQYIRYINERNSYITIHGANLSLSIPHDVRNYACGRTPICNECERLVNSGVVVVAAAGNRGYQNFETKEGLYESYAAFSVTDPGNADGVITVGATHRFWPHTYGVSFFSSRGPTGDGRIKPDLVAPGERIRAPFPNEEWGDLDGTSMAAPHVSGAAAMLMARYSELIGQPRRIKQILCSSATDLGREKSFQGHGMLDVLRAFQSI